MTTLKAKPASTVVLCHKKNKWPCEILLIKRNSQAKFLPNAHVFPGGQVEEQDYEKGLWYAQDERNIARIHQYFPFNPAHLGAHLAAAVRETLEEAGVFILRHTSGQIPCLDNIWPLSWWVTPPTETSRFDTWFFLATISADQIADFPHSAECNQASWLTPAKALREHEAGNIFLAPPTRAVLERMAHCDSLEHLMQFVDRPLRPIHPRFVIHKHQKILVLPGHELHQDHHKSGFIMKTSYLFK